MFRVEDVQVEPVIFGAAIGAGKFGQWRTLVNKKARVAAGLWAVGRQSERIVVAAFNLLNLANLLMLLNV